MAEKLEQLKQGKTAALAAALLVVGWIASPALAAPERDLLCADGADTNFDVSEIELTATPVNSSEEMLENHLLESDVKAAAREAFSDEDEEVEILEAEAADELETAEPRIQRVSDGEPVTIKRQMYRRDI